MALTWRYGENLYPDSYIDMASLRGVVFDLAPSFASVQHLAELQHLFRPASLLQRRLQLHGEELTHWSRRRGNTDEATLVGMGDEEDVTQRDEQMHTSTQLYCTLIPCL